MTEPSRPIGFREARGFETVAPGRRIGSVDPTWAQGRATYGGLVAAIGLAPMLELVPAERPIRSAAITFMGPLAPGEATCVTNLLREGRATTFVESTVLQKESPVCRVIGTFGEARSSAIAIAPPSPPRMPAPVDATELPYVDGLTPSFTRYFRLLWALGAFPFAGDSSAHIGGYCAFRESSRAADACDVLGLLDAWPAPVLSMLSQPAPASSVTWTVDFVAPSYGDASVSEAWPYEARAVAAGEGYAQTEAWLFSPLGQPIARSTQLVAVFG